jgi:hypothetical protein
MWVKDQVRILVGTRTSSSGRVLFAREKQPIAALDLRADQLTRSELDNGERAGCERHPPRPDGRFCSKHLAFAIDERDVNCKAHEKRVDAVARREDEGVAFGKTFAAEKTPIPCLALEGRFNHAGDEGAVGGIPKHPRTVRELEQRT